jgi:hypothetical protein
VNPNPAAWIGLAIALVALSSFPGMVDPIRYSLVLVILLVLLSHSMQVAQGLDRFISALGGGPRRSPPSAHPIANPVTPGAGK